jgi:hypothetical protein
MKKMAFAAIGLAALVGTPVNALEHQTIIDHPFGTIAAGYEGTIEIDSKQVGAASSPGRRSSLRCNWTVSITVERNAMVGEGFQTRRSMGQDKVLTGSTPGWCNQRAAKIDQMVEARRDDLRAALLALVEQDRKVLVAEADRTQARSRES